MNYSQKGVAPAVMRVWARWRVFLFHNPGKVALGLTSTDKLAAEYPLEDFDMGSHSVFFVDDFGLDDAKYGVNPIVMTLFRETDKRVYQRKVRDGYRSYWVPQPGTDPGDEDETAYEYVNTVKNVKQRLDTMGFSIGKTKLVFDAGIREEIESDIHDWDTDKEKTLDLLKHTQFEQWIDAYKEIRSTKIRQALYEKPDSPPHESPLVNYILSPDENDRIFHFPANDIRWPIRVFLETCPDDSLVVLDITDLIHGGSYFPEESLCADALAELTEDYPANQKGLILTEGSIDKSILEQSLQLLYPHLYEYFSFMDFGESNVQGGAPFLVSIVKAFAGSGIRNRIVALFDNDTGAQVALKGLDRTVIPNNIKVLKYPRLEFAKLYPTLGPGGIIALDINGLACSIELFLGRDILTQGSGELVPVQWKGYDNSLHQYQGEILNKKYIQDAFFKKLARARSDPAFLVEADWEPMRLLLTEIFQAFC